MFRTTTCVLVLAACDSAQLTVPISPRDTFLRINLDPGATDAVAIPIQLLGVQAGDWLRLRMLGDWDGGGSGDAITEMIGVFDGAGTLQSPALQHRLTAPVAAGSAFVLTTGTAIGNLPMDIGQDFWISRQWSSDEVTVRVPSGAAYLFVAVADNFYGDNTDPDFDLGVELSLVPAPPYEGTSEDLILGSGVGGLLDLTPVKTATAGNVIGAAVMSPLDLLAGSPFLVMADIRVTGTAPTGPFPGTWFGPNAAIALGIAVLPSGTPSNSLAITVPPGFAGFSLWLQGGALWGPARNGLFVASDAHEIRLQ